MQTVWTVNLELSWTMTWHMNIWKLCWCLKLHLPWLLPQIVEEYFTKYKTNHICSLHYLQDLITTPGTLMNFWKSHLSWLKTLTIALNVPMVDKSFIIRVNEVFYIPTAHPVLGKAFQYLLESDYLAVTEDQMFYCIPLEINVIACMGTKG